MLKSWAVTKGPSLDPDDEAARRAGRRSSARIRRFRGHHPEGEYGGGTVMLWDRGHLGDASRQGPAKTLEKGHLHIPLQGERRRGEWVLVPPQGQARRTARELDAEKTEG